MMMNRPVAQRDNHLRLIEHRITSRLLERRFMNQSRDIVLIRQLQRAVIFERPRDRQFQRSPRLEAGRTRISDRQRLRFVGGFKDVRPLRLQEGKIAHRRAP